MKVSGLVRVRRAVLTLSLVLVAVVAVLFAAAESDREEADTVAASAASAALMFSDPAVAAAVVDAAGAALASDVPAVLSAFEEARSGSEVSVVSLAVLSGRVDVTVSGTSRALSDLLRRIGAGPALVVSDVEADREGRTTLLSFRLSPAA